MIKYKKLHDLAQTPTRGSEYASGFDLRSVENAIIQPSQGAVLNTGLGFEVAIGWDGSVEPRSKIGSKKKILITAKVIDSDYRKSVMVALFNAGDEPFDVRVGDKIAQLVFRPVFTGELKEVAELSDTGRGGNGINCSEMRIK